ncbi:MAG: Hpt domain-containing protein [Magnetococcales bacterium]|nr:Hpt domain-containing protein [Magnetococcales bacterium]
MNSGHENHELLDIRKLNEMREELEEGFATVIRHYQAGILHRPERIRQAIRERDAEQVALESHSLKSVCRQVGLVHMGEMSAQLEAMGGSNELDAAEALVEQLIASSIVANQELSRYCQGSEPPRPFFAKDET